MTAQSVLFKKQQSNSILKWNEMAFGCWYEVRNQSCFSKDFFPFSVCDSFKKQVSFFINEKA